MKLKHRELLNKEQFGQLERGRFYGVYAEPGAGKTHMIKNGLVEYCEENHKTLLILTHRDSLKEQTKADLEEDIRRWEREFRGNGIIIMNYQAIEAGYKYNLSDKMLPLMNTDFVVCDEIHYLIKDSWNEQTDYSVQFLQESEGVKIFLTGTPKEMHVLNNMWNVERLINTNRQNNNLLAIRIYEKNSDLIEHINRYANDDCKVLSFLSGKTEKVLSLKNEHGGSFICSKNNDYYEDADKELIDIVIRGEKRKEQGILPTNKLWATSVWNEGVNIIDPDLEVVCSFQPRTSTEFIQQFARARRSDIIGCIVAPTRKMMVGQIKKCEDELEEILNDRIKQSEPTFRKMRELFLDESIRESREILEVGFGPYVAGIYESIHVYNYGQILRDQEISNYLSTLEDIKMFAEEQLRFKETMIDDYGFRDSNRKKIIGIKSFNNFLKNAGIEYELVRKRESSGKSEHYGKSYWKVQRKMTQLLYIALASKDVASKESTDISNGANVIETIDVSQEESFEKQLSAFKSNSNVTVADGKNLFKKMMMNIQKEIS